MESACKCHEFVRYRFARTLLLGALAWVALGAAAQAQSVPGPKCATDPPQPSGAITLTGFPAERTYIHSKHPQLCVDPSDKSCDATAYVVVGDSLKTSGDCSGWTFVEFDGKKKVTGWVATTRVVSTPSPLPVVSAESMPLTTHAVCREVERVMNAALRDPQVGRAILPSALESPTPVDQLPKRVGVDDDGQTWAGTVSEAHIQGHTLKAVSYSSGGTCHEDYLELWDPAFRNRVTVPDSNADSAESAEGYSSEDLVKLDGNPYFAHFSRSGDVTLSTFDKDLSAHPLCQVMRSASRVEAVKAAAEPALCEAVRTGSVLGAPIQDIEPYDLTPESFQFGAHGLELLQGTRNGLRIVARGHLDVDNDGRPDDVGMLVFGNGVDSAGCGHDVDTIVPIKLNPDGTPATASVFNLKMIESAGAGEDGRLLIIHGKVYFETKSHIDADGGLQHTVWELSASGRKNVCELLPVQYKVVDAK